MFLNDEISLNLISAAQNKYSANVLAQPHKYKQQKKMIAEKDVGAEAEQEAKKMSKQLVVTFQRREILFDNRKCYMLNLRDITEQENILSRKEKTEKFDNLNI